MAEVPEMQEQFPARASTVQNRSSVIAFRRCC